MSGGIATIIGAAIGAIATAAGVIVQTLLRNRADAERCQEIREIDQERQRRELAQRYLFQVQDAVVSLRMRLENWARRGGQQWSESVDAGYWDFTTLYALGQPWQRSASCPLRASMRQSISSSQAWQNR